MRFLRSLTAVFLSLTLLVGATFVESNVIKIEKLYANEDPSGGIQDINQDYVQGWAYDADLGTLPAEVKIYIDGNFYRSTMADISMPALVTDGLTPTPEHGFIVRFDRYNFTPGLTYEIRAYAIDNSTRAEIELSGSPASLTITGGGGGTPNAVINVRGINHYTGELLVLDATSSTTTSYQTFNPGPPANLTFNWTLTAIPNNSAATLSSTTNHTISFTPDLVGDYTVELIVTDPVNSETDQTSVTITVIDYSSPPAGPDPISFVDIFDAELDTVYNSNTNTISGFSGVVSSIVLGGINTSIVKNGFDTGSTSVMVGDGDTIALKSTSAGTADTLQTITLTIDSSNFQWQIKTAKNAGGVLPEIVYHHADHLGSGSVDTDENGDTVELIDYYPFGTPRIDENLGGYDNDYKFTGKELDKDTDLYYYGARYYDAKIGRFTAIDPVALKNPSKVLEDPQQLNTYSYTRNNPLKYVDPEGEIIKDASFVHKLTSVLTFDNFGGGGGWLAHSARGFASNPNPSTLSELVGRQVLAFGRLMSDASFSDETWDAVTTGRILGLDSQLHIPATDFINMTESGQGTQLRVTDGYRSVEEQNSLYAQGRTTPGNVVTRARGGTSYHNYGLAIDVVEMNKGQPVWNNITNDVANVGTGLGFEWGGNWSNFPDYPHFQMTQGQSISDLQGSSQ